MRRLDIGLGQAKASGSLAHSAAACILRCKPGKSAASLGKARAAGPAAWRSNVSKTTLYGGYVSSSRIKGLRFIQGINRNFQTDLVKSHRFRCCGGPCRARKKVFSSTLFPLQPAISPHRCPVLKTEDCASVAGPAAAAVRCLTGWCPP